MRLITGKYGTGGRSEVINHLYLEKESILYNKVVAHKWLEVIVVAKVHVLGDTCAQNNETGTYYRTIALRRC